MQDHLGVGQQTGGGVQVGVYIRQIPASAGGDTDLTRYVISTDRE